MSGTGGEKGVRVNGTVPGPNGTLDPLLIAILILPVFICVHARFRGILQGLV